MMLPPIIEESKTGYEDDLLISSAGPSRSGSSDLLINTTQMVKNHDSDQLPCIEESKEGEMMGQTPFEP